jgi:hypothetical protein
LTTGGATWVTVTEAFLKIYIRPMEAFVVTNATKRFGFFVANVDPHTNLGRGTRVQIT